jgi:hypothetical protein
MILSFVEFDIFRRYILVEYFAVFWQKTHFVYQHKYALLIRINTGFDRKPLFL